LLPLAAASFCVGELNDQLVRLDFDPNDMSVDEDCILDLGGCIEAPPNRFCDESFNLIGRDPADGPGLFSSSLQQGRRDVVPILDASLAGMALRRERNAGIDIMRSQRPGPRCTLLTVL
jgi:hypothetical protein